MKILTCLGTRPEIIRLSGLIELLDRCVDHIMVDTGQNYDDTLSGRFYRELGVRLPDERLDVRAANFGDQIGQILSRGEAAIRRHMPDRLLVLGDTNSGLIALVARRLGIPVYHMEAGNRCYDQRVPEEVNRRVIDHCSTVLLPYTARSKENLIREGLNAADIYVTGNPIRQVLERFAPQVQSSAIMSELEVRAGEYFLVTAHRAENVDSEARLAGIVDALNLLRREYDLPVLYPVHPRTRSRLERFGLLERLDDVQVIQPLGLFDFVRLEQSAFCILSDSGTVQEEACLFGVPNVTIRETTERPETLECGSNILAGCEARSIARAVKTVVDTRGRWTPPAEYLALNVAETVCRIVTGYRLSDLAEQDWQQRARD